jgi:hypothetical protein
LREISAPLFMSSLLPHIEPYRGLGRMIESPLSSVVLHERLRSCGDVKRERHIDTDQSRSRGHKGRQDE